MLPALNRFFSMLNGIVSAYGGHIDYLTGDRLVAVFNHPFNQKNYQNKAARTALAIIEASRKLSLNHPKKGSVVFKVGLAQGEVITGYLGTRRHREFRVVGTPISLAEHLTMLESDHGVIAAGKIRWQLGRDFNQNDLGTWELLDGQSMHCVSILAATQHFAREIHDGVLALLNDIDSKGLAAGEKVS